jgi:hypothetical protein
MKRLGKQEHKYDARTLRLAAYIQPDIRVPAAYDFDKGKTMLPIVPWGNNVWGNSVIAGEANHLLRLERMEQRRTIRMTADMVISRYKKLSGAEKPQDEKDIGLNVLDAMRDWRENGFRVNNQNFKIAAYGELEPSDDNQLRAASYTLHGIHFGFWLPRAVEREITVWDWNGETGPDWQPGSWGGHLVYSKAYNRDGHEVLSWGKKIFVTNNFIEHYCDEAWAVVDSLDSWRVKQVLDVDKLVETLSEISDKPLNR